MSSSVSRRELLAALICAGSAAALPGSGRAAARDRPLRVDAARLRQTLEGLSEFGRPAGGSFADGVSRVAYSDADVAGRSYVMQLLRAANCEPRVDAAGNISARRPGRNAAAAPIVLGSHVDSVPHGGNFDGDLGSLAAVEVLRTLDAHGVRTEHPVEVAIWSNEEGGTVGSRAAVGELTAADLDRSFNGVRMREGLPKIGGDPARVADARRASGSVHAYLELHIEQGAILDRAKVPIGVVDGIVSIDEYEVEIRGFANHAGTTPMPDRRNALLAAAQLIEAVQEEVTKRPGRQVGTVGQLTVTPNAPNVVPGLVRHTIEFRDLSEAVLADLGTAIRARAERIARETGTEITLTQVEHLPPALANPQIQRRIEAAAAGLGLATMHLPSGAGHDAQMLARIAPMGMIFVPSVRGISHSPLELTSWQDCANGADVLLGTLLAVDRG